MMERLGIGSVQHQEGAGQHSRRQHNTTFHFKGSWTNEGGSARKNIRQLGRHPQSPAFAFRVGLAEVDEDTPDFRGMTYAVISTRWHAPISQIAHLRHAADIPRSANSVSALDAENDKGCRLERIMRARLPRYRY